VAYVDALGRTRVEEIARELESGKMPAEILEHIELMQIVGLRLDTIGSKFAARWTEEDFKTSIEVAIEVNTTMQPDRDFRVNIFIKDLGYGERHIQRRIQVTVTLRPHRDSRLSPVKCGHAWMIKRIFPIKAWFNNSKVEAYA